MDQDSFKTALPRIVDQICEQLDERNKSLFHRLRDWTLETKKISALDIASVLFPGAAVGRESAARGAVRKLKQHLERYYLGRGADDQIRIKIEDSYYHLVADPPPAQAGPREARASDFAR